MGETTASANASRYLAGLARRLKDNPDFMAYVLSVYQTQERLDDTALAERLGTSLDMLSRLALCKRPSTKPEQFADQVRQITVYVGIDSGVLANVIRQVDSLEALERQATALDSDRQATYRSHTEAGLLAAARDRSEAYSEESPSSEQESSAEDEQRCPSG
jgi:hypothetical protein